MTHALRPLGALALPSLLSACVAHAVAEGPAVQGDAVPSPAPAVVRTSLGAVTAAEVARALEGYGDWRETNPYGRVWFPRAQQGFVPYGTDGQWRVTDAGWYWQSTLPWGALAFHYGRWVQLDGLWGWVPGSQFAPAWVDWRVGNGWVAWAPRPPRNSPWAPAFAYCPSAQVLAADVWRRVLSGATAASLYPRTTAIASRRGFGGAVYAPGPSSTDVPSPQAVPLGSVAVPITIRPRPAPGLQSGLALAGYVPPPDEIPEEPVAQGEPEVALRADDDARPAVRIRESDLARGQGGLSVVSLPYGTRAALFAQRAPRTAPEPAAPAVPETTSSPPPLPPPADLPLAWRTMPALPRAPSRPGMGYASPVQLPPSVGAPSSPGIGVTTWQPPPAQGNAVAVPMGRAAPAPAPTVAMPVAGPSVMNAPAIFAAPTAPSLTAN